MSDDNPSTYSNTFADQEPITKERLDAIISTLRKAIQAGPRPYHPTYLEYHLLAMPYAIHQKDRPFYGDMPSS